MNRADKTITTEFTIDMEDGSEFAYEKSVLTAIEKTQETKHDHYLFDD